MRDSLRHISIFSELSDEELDLLAAAASERQYPRNSYIVRKGDPGTSLFLVLSGEVKVVLEESPNKEIRLSTFTTGDFFGEMSLFDGRPRSATVIAQEDSRVIEISRESFVKQIFKHPEISLKILAEIVTRFRNTDEVVKDYADQIYREAYVSLEKIMQNELNTAKTIYQKTEERALKTIENVENSGRMLTNHVESSWKTLIRTISIVITVFTFIGTLFGILGYKGISDINKMVDEAKEAHANILDIGESTKNTEILRHTMLFIRKVKNDLSLNKNLDEIDTSSLIKASVYFQPSIDVLLEYLKNYKTYKPEIVIDAAEALLHVARKSDYLLKEEESRHIYESHIWILNSISPNDWRTSLEVRQNLMAMGKLEKKGSIEKIVLLPELKKIVSDKSMWDFDQTKLNAVRILVNLKEVDSIVRNPIIELLHQYVLKGKNFWIRQNAAIGLIKIGNFSQSDKEFTTGYEYMLKSMNKRDDEGFWASLSLGALDKKTLTRISRNEKRNVADEIVSKIKDVLHADRSRNNMNGYLRQYAKRVAEYIGDRNRRSFSGLQG